MLGVLPVLFKLGRPAILFSEMSGQIFVEALEFVMIGDDLIEPLFVLAELAFEEMDMVLALAQQVRGAGYVEKGSQIGKWVEAARPDEEVRFMRGAVGGRHPHIDGRLDGITVKCEGFETILKEDLNVREKLLERGLEFAIFEFVDVIRIRAVERTRFRVVQTIRSGDQKKPVGVQHAAGFRQQCAPVCKVLDDLEGGDELE